MKILVVDDDPGMRECLTAMCELEGHSVIAAGTLREAMDVLESDEIEAVVVDGHFPFDAGLPVVPLGPFLLGLAVGRGLRHCLVSGDSDLVTGCQLSGIPALLKPASQSKIFALLDECPARVHSLPPNIQEALNMGDGTYRP